MALITVVEDEFFLALMLADILEDEGHKVETAANGKIALHAIADCQPDLVITDYMMPFMTGLELARTLRADASLKHIPIILVSGAQASIGQEHPDLFDAVLEKPYLNDDLLAAVQRLLTR